jgi:SAM-dependent methyltransferase
LYESTTAGLQQSTGLPPSAFDPDLVNRGTWQRPDTVEQYRKLRGWTDPGEQKAVAYVAAQVRGQPVLDIGMGAGRTAELLQPFAGEYLGIDYTAEMVEAARAAHPTMRFEHMDARDLSSLQAGHYGLAMFSFNGIDSVAVGDRGTILRQVHRVLKPGGLFIVSAHNRHGPGAGERPRLDIAWTPNPVRLAWRIAKQVAALPRAVRNHRKWSRVNEVHDDWALMNAGAHDFGIVVVYTSLAEQKRQLREAGFTVEVVYDSATGAVVRDGDDTRAAWWFHYVVRKSAA